MTTIDITRGIIGRRRKITRDEMATIILALIDDIAAASTIAYIDDKRSRAQLADEWARMCHSDTCISVWGPVAGKPGYIRYDAPGSMVPHQHSDLCFVPHNVSTSTLAYMRRHAGLVLQVRDTRLASDLAREQVEAQVQQDRQTEWLRRLERVVEADGKWTRILADGTLELRDMDEGLPSGIGQKKRYQFRCTNGELQRRVMPPENIGDTWADIGAPVWEPSDPPRFGPVRDYYEACAL